jgi:hypothetical protein
MATEELTGAITYWHCRARELTVEGTKGGGHSRDPYRLHGWLAEEQSQADDEEKQSAVELAWCARLRSRRRQMWEQHGVVGTKRWGLSSFYRAGRVGDGRSRGRAAVGEVRI